MRRSNSVVKHGTRPAPAAAFAKSFFHGVAAIACKIDAGTANRPLELGTRVEAGARA